MPEQQTGGDPQNTDAGDPQQQQTAAQGDPKRDGKADERDAFVEKLRRNEKTLVKQVADLQAKLKEHEDSKLTETERVASRVRELEDENRSLKEEIATAALRDAARVAAAKAGAIRPEAVVRLIDLKAVQTDDAGGASNIDELVERVRAEAPELFAQARPGSADAGARGNANGTQDMSALIRRASGRRV